MAGRVVLYTRGPVLLGRIGALAARLDLQVVSADEPDVSDDAEASTLDEPPIAAIAELEMPNAVDRIAEWRKRWPDALLAGSISVPDQALWHGAVAAGADLVANRGALVPQLARALEVRSGRRGPAARPHRLQVRLTERDSDGLVGRLPDAPGGSIVVFRVGDRLHAFRDECPHAGASLADGDLVGTIITCPRHGSQFDVTTGSRERGPSDFAIRTYSVVSEDGLTFVEVAM